MTYLTAAAIAQDGRGLKLDTLVRLRWLAVTGQCVTVSIVHFPLGFRLPFGACLGVIAVAAAINLWLRLQRPASHRLGNDAATALLAFDVLQLAALLYLTGGLQNPFALLFMAPVLISATALPPMRTVGLGCLAVACTTGLALSHHKLPWNGTSPMELPHLYVGGIWASIVLGLVFTSAFAYRISEEARQLTRALAATELVLAREQHLSQLDGLAAAAAHELGTPLATIALVAKELDHQAPADSPMKEDTQLLRSQVERCREILGKLTSLDEGDGGDFLAGITLGQLVEEVAGPERAFDIVIETDCAGDGPEPACRRSPGLMFGLGNLLDNAVDFATTQVAVTARWTREEVALTIRDDGPGFASEVLLRIGEPYVTTRGRRRDAGGDADGSGLGLGLFIAKTLIERSGAQLSLFNADPPAAGAIARIVWPRDAFERDRPFVRVAPARTLSDATIVPI